MNVVLNNYLDGIDVIYWINRNIDMDRRKRMLKMFYENSMFNGIPIIRIPAVDGEQKNVFRYIHCLRPEISCAEYACAVSHYMAIHSFSKTRYKTALILEDDMTLDFMPFWKNSVSKIMNRAPNDWEIIQLCYISDHIPQFEYEKIEINNTNRLYSTGAYLIKHSAAKNTIKNVYNIYEKKYEFIYSNLNHQIDYYLYSINKTYCYKYPLFIYGFNNASSINKVHSTFHYESRLQIEQELHYLLKCEEYKIYQLYTTVGIICALLGSILKFARNYNKNS